jgi:5-formyltetrahydrofolate cyclo-ligase
MIILPGLSNSLLQLWKRYGLRTAEGVAFDRSLSRIGHGKGYYDRFISRYVDSGRQRPLLGLFSQFAPYTHAYRNTHFSVAVALREQVLDVGVGPFGDNDWKMDIIVSPDETIGDNV